MPTISSTNVQWTSALSPTFDLSVFRMVMLHAVLQEQVVWCFDIGLHMVAGKSSEGNSEVLGHVVWWCVELLRSLLFVILSWPGGVSRPFLFVLCYIVQQGEAVLRAWTMFIFFFRFMGI
ncbi:hypothetical protein QYE76_047768 [Lolium multiflorum]|uniref:Uncharacterized protein n=1 Tax=Lolium multiflorum TaxID=4521 RepID=A0AAD8TQH4_LOLMU|nr:hypothetical protein QYE76_047768 [Lolium multiflorum]